MTSFPWVDFGRLLIYFILGLSLKDNGKTNSVAIFLRSSAILTRLQVYFKYSTNYYIIVLNEVYANQFMNT
jgi:hypothetical protein